MKILLICENYYPHYGGAEVLFKNLAERYVQQGHQVTVLTHQLRGTPQEEEINGVLIRRVPSFHSRYLFSFLSIPMASRIARHCDLIQTTTFNAAPPAWLAARLRHKPVVLTVHEIWQGNWRKITGFGWWKSTLHELLERALYLLPYDGYVSVSEATKRDLLQLGLDEKKVKRIYNGFDYAFWSRYGLEKDKKWKGQKKREQDKEKRKKSRKKLGWEKNIIFLSWGRPAPSKGFDHLLQAFVVVRQRLPQARLLLLLRAGKNSMRLYQQTYARLHQLVQKLELHTHVTIIPSFTYPELGNYLQAADGVVIPSLSEGFGYAALEAVAMNKPLLVSDAGSLPEVVGGNYLIFRRRDVKDLAEKMQLLAQKKWLCREPRSFSWEETVQQYLELYEKVLAERGG